MEYKYYKGYLIRNDDPRNDNRRYYAMVQEIFIRENIKTHRIEIIMKEYLGTTKWQSFMFKGVFGNTEAYISSMTPIDGGYIELLKAYIKEDNAA